MSIINFSLFKRKKQINCRWDKYYTKEELNLKIPDISLYDQVLNTSLKYPDNIAYKYMGKKVSYKTFLEEINKASIAFRNSYLKESDVVTICLPNIPEAIISFYALNRLGCICNMVHPLSSGVEIRDSINSTKSKYLIILDKFYENIKDEIINTDIEKVIFVSPVNSLNIFLKTLYNIKNIGKYKKYPKCDTFISYNKFLNTKTVVNFKITNKFGKNTPCCILHSGGTSGNPKNVLLQNRAFLLGSIQEGYMLKNLEPGDCCLAILPNFHGFGLGVCIHVPLTLGCYTILVPEFNSKKFDILFNKEKPTCVLGVPTLYEALISNNNIKNLDLSYLKYVISGGDTLPESLEDRINNYLKEHGAKTVITQGYGLSEALAAVCLATPSLYKKGSIGIPLPTNVIKIIDPKTRLECKPNEIGEICINSRGFMLEYLNNKKETNEVLQVHKDNYIWLHTGDLGYMDTDGFIFYTGRIKRMIITSGYNVYPSHIEKIIESHPAVLQCTVIGIPHPYKQEVPKAYIVLKDGIVDLGLIKLDIKNYCKKNLAKYMIPYEFEFRKKLPKTKLGKIDFNKLKIENNK